MGYNSKSFAKVFNSFEDIFPKDKVYIRLYFLKILLTQNKELLIQYIKSFFL